MKRVISVAILVTVMGLLDTGPARAAAPPVDIAAQIGAVIPDGTLNDYASTGFSILGRGVYHVPSAPAIGLWGDLNLNLFSSETIKVRIPVTGTGGVSIPVDQTTTQTGFNFHLGAQLGSGNRKAFFRPRVGAGLGVYNFRTEISWKGFNADEEIASETTDSDWGWGWRGMAGADWFVSPRWGIATDVLFDQVYSLDKRKGEIVDDSASGFTTIMVGAVFALDRLEK